MDDRPELDQINLVAGGMGASVEFHRLLGIEIEDPPAPWDEHHRTVETADGLDLDIDGGLVASQWNEGWPRTRRGVVLGFRVAQRATVDAIHSRPSEAGHTGEQPLSDAFCGARDAIVTDNLDIVSAEADADGNAVGIMSGVDPDRRQRPPTRPERRAT